MSRQFHIRNDPVLDQAVQNLIFNPVSHFPTHTLAFPFKAYDIIAAGGASIEGLGRRLRGERFSFNLLFITSHLLFVHTFILDIKILQSLFFHSGKCKNTWNINDRMEHKYKYNRAKEQRGLIEN